MPSIQKRHTSTRHMVHDTRMGDNFGATPAELPLGELPPLPKHQFGGIDNPVSRVTSMPVIHPSSRGVSPVHTGSPIQGDLPAQSDSPARPHVHRTHTGDYGQLAHQHQRQPQYRSPAQPSQMRPHPERSMPDLQQHSSRATSSPARVITRVSTRGSQMTGDLASPMRASPARASSRGSPVGGISTPQSPVYRTADPQYNGYAGHGYNQGYGQQYNQAYNGYHGYQRQPAPQTPQHAQSNQYVQGNQQYAPPNQYPQTNQYPQGQYAQGQYAQAQYAQGQYAHAQSSHAQYPQYAQYTPPAGRPVTQSVSQPALSSVAHPAGHSIYSPSGLQSFTRGPADAHDSQRTMSMSAVPTPEPRQYQRRRTPSSRQLQMTNASSTSLAARADTGNRRVTSSPALTRGSGKERIYSTGSLTSRGGGAGMAAAAAGVTSSARYSEHKPSVYPAMLSQVAAAFSERIQPGTRYKNGLEYRGAFTGTEAVDVICQVIRTSDRNLALLLGRSLDAQRFYHDVTYEHRLRDSTNEVYQLVEGAEVNGVFTLLTECYSPTCSRDSVCYSIACPRRLEQQARQSSRRSSGAARAGSTRATSARLSEPPEEQKPYWQLTVPKTLLTSLDKREIKRQECIFETIYSERDFVKDLEYLREFWIRPLSETKIIRASEREHFVKTVFYGINEIWEVNSKFAQALTQRQQQQPVVGEIADIFLEFIPRFEPFIKYGAGQVMGRYEFDRQKRHNPFFVRFIEDTSNRAESRRLDVSSYLSKPTTRPARYPLLLRSIRKHTDPGSKDYENLGKAMEMLQKMLKRINYETGKASDRLNLFLLKQKLVFRPGELVDLRLTAENRKLLYQCTLHKRSSNNTAERTDRQGEVQAYLFDHALLLVKVKVLNRREVYRVYQRPMPIPLTFLSLNEEAPTLKAVKRAASMQAGGSTTAMLGETASSGGNSGSGNTASGLRNSAAGNIVRANSAGANLSSANNSSANNNSTSSGAGANSTGSIMGLVSRSGSGFQLASTAANCPLSFTYIGRNGYKMTLYATPAVQRMLAERIEQQSRKLIEDNDVFTLTPLSSHFFDNNNKINCVVPFDGGRKLLYGTDSGIYVSDVKFADAGSRTVSRPRKVISRINIIQADILGEYQILLALSDKKLFYWPLSVLSGPERGNGNGGNGRGGVDVRGSRQGKELMSHVSFFKVGVCSGRMLVCAAKSSSNTIRVFEPIDPVSQHRQKKRFRSETRDVSFSSEPVSVNFLKTKLCVGCSKGFEIVSLGNDVMEQLLDPADTSLDFAIGREGLKPLEIDRINSDFLLSYSSFSFFINHNGWRSRPKWIIHWEGVPHAFALWYPYLLAFDSNMIEIRHVETGDLLRVIAAENIRFLHSSSQEILYAYEDDQGYDVVASLDFWNKTVKSDAGEVSKDHQAESRTDLNVNVLR